MGNRSPLKTWPGKGDRFETQARLGTAGQRDGVDGDAELLRLPDGARHAAQILVAVGDQQQARHHAGGQRRRAVADGGFQIRAAARWRRRYGADCQLALSAFVAAATRVVARERNHARPVAARGLSTCVGDGRFALQILRRNAGRGVGQHATATLLW